MSNSGDETMSKSTNTMSLTEQQANECEAEIRALDETAHEATAMRLLMQSLMPCGHAYGNLLTCDSPPFGCVICNSRAPATPCPNCADMQRAVTQTARENRSLERLCAEAQAATVWDRAIEIVESFETIHEEIVDNSELVFNANLRKIVAALEAARENK